MIRINLLPHRELKRKARQEQVAILVGIVFTVGLLMIWTGYDAITGKIDAQNGRNQYLSNHIAVLDQQIGEIRDIRSQIQELLSRKGVVEALQGNRTEVVHLLDQLVRQLPDGVHLKSIKQSGQNVNLNGYAQSNAWVSTLMKNLESSQWLETPVLIEIKAVNMNNVRQNEFNLNVRLKSLERSNDIEEPHVL